MGSHASIWGQLALCAALLAPALPVRADVIERVVAVINDDAIFLSELRRRAAPFLESMLADATTEVERMTRIKDLYKKLLDQLVDEELVEQSARKMVVSVTSLEVDQAIERVRDQNKLSAEQFWEAVRNQGFTEKQYRGDVRKQLLRLKVTNQRVRSRVNVSDERVREIYDQRVRRSRRSQRFKAAHIYLELPTASATEVAEATRRARAIRQGLTPDGFDAAMQKHGGTDLGWLEQGDLSEALENALLALSPGQIGAPVRGPSGIHIFLLRERQEGGQELPPFDEAKLAIQSELMQTALIRQEKLFLSGLRKGAIIDIRQ